MAQDKRVMAFAVAAMERAIQAERWGLAKAWARVASRTAHRIGSVAVG